MAEANRLLEENPFNSSAHAMYKLAAKELQKLKDKRKK